MKEFFSFGKQYGDDDNTMNNTLMIFQPVLDDEKEGRNTEVVKIHG